MYQHLDDGDEDVLDAAEMLLLLSEELIGSQPYREEGIALLEILGQRGRALVLRLARTRAKPFEK